MMRSACETTSSRCLHNRYLLVACVLPLCILTQDNAVAQPTLPTGNPTTAMAVTRPQQSSEQNAPQSVTREHPSQPSLLVHNDALLAADALAGEYTQLIRDEQGQVLNQSSGEFSLLKPHYIRWREQEPGSQLLVSDGEWLWHYDIDLETVSRQPLASTLGTPLRILTQPVEQLRVDYTLEREGSRVRLLPKGGDASFRMLILTFDKTLPTQLYIEDKLDQAIVVTLNARRATDLSPEDFSFTPPETATVYTESR